MVNIIFIKRENGNNNEKYPKIVLCLYLYFLDIKYPIIDDILIIK